MALFPASPNRYPAAQKAFPAAPNAYPCAVNSYPPGGGLLISGYAATGGLTGYSWKWDTKTAAVLTGSAPNQYVPGEQYTRLVLDVPGDCGFLDVQAIPTAAFSGNGELGNTVDVAIGHVKQSHALSFTTPGVKQTVRLTVPGSGVRRVELFEQLCYITGITPQTTAKIVLPASHAASAVFIGASGTMGYYALNPADSDAGVLVFLWSWAGQVKALGTFGASYLLGINSYGITAWGVVDRATADTFVATYVTPRMTGTSRKVVWYEMMAGDMISNATTPAQWATRMGHLLDATIAAHPTAEIKLQTSVVWGAEATPNAGGFLMQDYRAVAPALAAARPANVMIAVGYAGGATPSMSTAPGDLQDGAHLTPTAMRDKAGPYAIAIL